MEPTQNVKLLEKNTEMNTSGALVKRTWVTPEVELISDTTIQSGNDINFPENYQPVPPFPITGSAS